MKNFVRNENRFELREPLRSFLTSVKNIFNADACVLYLISGDEMDVEEKKQEFSKRFPNGIEGIDKDQEEKYKILKFIGVDDLFSNEDENYSLWTFSYKQRPNKYIIFDIEKETPISGEGITGMSARLKKIFILHGEEIIKHPARHEDNDTSSKIHPTCTDLISIPIIKDKKLIGILRLDIYDLPDREPREFDLKYLDQLTDDFEPDSQCNVFNPNNKSLLNQICNEVIIISNKNANKLCYERLFGGIKLLNTIKKTNKIIKNSTSCPKNKELCNLVEHLFFVFKRNTYIGYDEILKRVIYFIEDVFDLFEMQDYFSELIKPKLDEFRDHEQLLLYNIEKYRDHFMHQFHVFVLGYVIINFLGIESITNIINKRLDKVKKYKNIKLNDESILRIWILASLFHDIAYIFEEYDQKMTEFIGKQLHHNIPIFIDWGKLLARDSNLDTHQAYIDILEELTVFFEYSSRTAKINKERLFKNYIEALQYKQDHGIMSALLLIELFQKHISKKIKNGDFGSRPEQSNIRKAEIYLAGLAISLHNASVFQTLQNQISFEHFPIEFLLTYCDSAQEWGRKKELKKVPHAAPELYSVDLQESSNNKKQIACTLCYRTSNAPDCVTLSTFFEKKFAHFTSRRAQFKIVYTYAAGDEIASFPFRSS